ncbi:TPA: L-rhamnose isomerase [Candidatus Poribacteria bacterium]|nr:L-rhamnose isomerase [Candidatus Poribacteria bacterium]HIB88764.1 L-rhamnose isomerase [Candidatus Poribacteria bacterium]HIC00322.1 L-rhamnose isomerase [Candidatus Poribacteria bacterium]HIN32051.1 L-rhamnose isomerase [Candidatus Poribacteria bacterium]HIO05952.1 L-rhamnose isomerase [Candidatus Poribacteria bacterium]
MSNIKYDILADDLTKQGHNVDKIRNNLKKQHIETPSWGYGNSGTRFGVFHQEGAARNAAERLEDAATVHKYTGVSPTVALHIPWDQTDDWDSLQQYAADLNIGIGAINPNVFQDQIYKLGSVCNPDSSVRRVAIDHMLECVDIMSITGSQDLSLWFADGTNFPGQGNFRQRKHWMEEALREVFGALNDNQRMLIEYKFFEPGFYHTDLTDWGTAYVMAKKLGDKAQVLIDLGHHPLGINIEFIVAYLIDEDKLGGFHFNCKKFADDDLTVGSINPQELFLIYNELVAAELDPEVETDIAYMIDQSHNLKPKVEASLQSVCNLQTAYAKALIVDRQSLAEAQAAGEIIDAEQILQRAVETDVRPLLEQVRLEMDLDPDPLTAYRKSGYFERISKARVGGESQGWA